MRRPLSAALFILGMLVGSEQLHGTARAAVSHKEQDGIAAELSVNSDAALVRWRFLRQPEAPLDEVSASFNGRPLGVPSVQAYPAAGEITAAIALLDVTGLSRQDEIDRFKAAMLLLAAHKAPHDQIGFAVYGIEASLLVPRSEDAREVRSILMQVPPLDEPANLSGALLSSMRTLSSVAAARRAVFVFTDGHNDGAVGLEALAKAARSTGVAVNFVTAPSERQADLAALTKLAVDSGGQLVAAADMDAFMAEPFALLDSGALVRFPLDSARRLFWDSQSTLEVVFRYGDKRLPIQSAATLPAATIGETAAYIAGAHPVGMLGAGGAGFAFGGVAVMAFAKRRRRTPPPNILPAQGNPAAAVPASLVDLERGAVFPLKSPLTRIGRNADNDIVLDEATVGRFHAIVQQTGDCTFSIQDQSTINGTMLNDRRIDSAPLYDGDLVRLGSRTLRFTQAVPHNSAGPRNSPKHAEFRVPVSFRKRNRRARMFRWLLVSC